MSVVPGPVSNYIPSDLNDLPLAAGFSDGDFPKRQGGVWVPADPTTGLPAGTLLGDTYTAAFGDATPANLFDVPVDFVLEGIRVVVLETWDGIGANIQLGTAGDPDRFFAIGDTELTAEVSFDKGFHDLGPLTIQLTIAPGVGASQGQIQIQTIWIPV